MTLRRGRNAGQPPSSFKVIGVRDLTRADLSRLLVKRDTAAPLIKRLRDPHHLLARLIASGLTQVDAGARAGYSYNRVCQLMADPTFKNLVATYRGQATEAWRENVDTFFELAHSNMLKAERQLAEKLEAAEEQEEFLPTRDLIAISRDAADRLGYGKHSKQTNVNVDFAAMLEKAIARSGKVLTQTGAQAPPLLEHSGAGSTSPPLLPDEAQPHSLRRRA